MERAEPPSSQGFLSPAGTLAEGSPEPPTHSLAALLGSLPQDLPLVLLLSWGRAEKPAWTGTGEGPGVAGGQDEEPS